MARGKKNKSYRIVAGDGDPCPRCGRATQIREHAWLGAKHFRAPFYFRRWFNCVNPACSVSLYMVERFKVWNEHVKAKEVKDAAIRGEIVWGDTWADDPKQQSALAASSGPAPWE
jgi:hypothetical protein